MVIAVVSLRVAHVTFEPSCLTSLKKFIGFILYLVFSCQYFILLRVFDVHLPFFDGMLMVFCVFFVLSMIPTISVAELGIRGSVAIYFFGKLSGNKLGIITASFGLWLINLVLPALIGSLFVFNLKFFRRNKHYLDE